MMQDDDTMYPFEVVLQGTPISLQSKKPVKREAWKRKLADVALERRKETYELGFIDERPVAITIYYFPAYPMQGDIDNIVKPIIDAMIYVVFPDDQVVERVTVQKFEPDQDWEFQSPSEQLAVALEIEKPVVYVRVDDDLSWRRI
jgi:Holliday junction resolvase RusA-like endonuclease